MGKETSPSPRLHGPYDLDRTPFPLQVKALAELSKAWTDFIQHEEPWKSLAALLMPGLFKQSWHLFSRPQRFCSKRATLSIPTTDWCIDSYRVSPAKRCRGRCGVSTHQTDIAHFLPSLGSYDSSCLSSVPGINSALWSVKISFRGKPELGVGCW